MDDGDVGVGGAVDQEDRLMDAGSEEQGGCLAEIDPLAKAGVGQSKGDERNADWGPGREQLRDAVLRNLLEAGEGTLCDDGTDAGIAGGGLEGDGGTHGDAEDVDAIAAGELGEVGNPAGEVLGLVQAERDERPFGAAVGTGIG